MKYQIVASAGRAALALEALLRPRTRSVRPEAARSVLVLEYMLPLGSCVHMTPVFEALRQRPGMTVTVATRGLALALLRHSPYIDHLIETPDPLTDLRGAARSLGQQLRARGLVPGCVLTGASDQRTRIGLLGALAVPAWRGGFTVSPALYQRPLAYDAGLSLIGNNLRLAELLGGQAAALEPKVFFTAADAAYARALLEPLRGQGKPVLIAVTQGSGGQRTGWHGERWRQTLVFARQTLGYALAYAGTPADRAPIEALRAEAGGVSLAGQTTVPQLAALLAQSDMVVSLDTGTMHVGRAVGVPMVVLGPSWQKPLEWLPLGKPHVRILRGPDRVGVPDHYQLDEIEAPAVEAALAELSRLYPALESARAARVEAGLSSVDLLAQSS